RKLAGYALRPAVFIEAAHPVDFHEGLALQEFAGRAVKHIHQTVTIRPKHGLAHLALVLDVCQYRHLSGVVVHLIVRGELVVPLQFAGVRVKSDHAVRIEIVTEADRTIAVGRRIARSPEGQIRLWIVSSGVPDGGTPGFPRICGPRFVTNFTGAWNS